MAGEMEKISSLSGRVHVLLRRESSRIVDVEWMTSNADYVREILRVIRSTENTELHELAQRIEALHPCSPEQRRLSTVTRLKKNMQRNICTVCAKAATSLLH